MTTINFAHANGFPAPSYQTFFSYLQAQLPEPNTIIAKHVYIYNNTCQGFSIDFTSIRQALGDKFNYSELMEGR